MALSLVGAAVVKVKQGQVYAACRPAALSTADEPCEGGALGAAPGGADASGAVIVLPGDVPASLCLTQTCAGLEWAARKLNGSGIDTSAPTGTEFTLQFVLADAPSGKLLSVNRTIIIEPPCSADDEVLCPSDGTCSALPCDIRDALAPLPADGPSILTLFGPLDLEVAYGTDLSGSLAPCASSAAAADNDINGSSDSFLPLCGATATDSAGGDVSADIRVAQIGDEEEASCSVGIVVSGPPFCLPGLYTYRCAVRERTLCSHPMMRTRFYL
jgi:hypothetical protein